MNELICIGNALVDFVVHVSDQELKTLGFKKGGMQLLDSLEGVQLAIGSKKHSMQGGGSAGNVAYNYGLLKGKGAFIGSVGKDVLGDFLEKNFHEHNVDTLFSKKITDTGRVYAMVTPDGERTFGVFLGAAQALTQQDVLQNMQDTKALHIEGYLMDGMLKEKGLQEIIRYAKEQNIITSIDLGDAGVIKRHPKIKKLAKDIDIIFMNEDEAQAFEPEQEKLIDFFQKHENLLVLKEGKKGSIIIQGEKRIQHTIRPVTPVDTTGAGDAYAAGFLKAYLNEKSFEEAAALGSQLSKQVVLQTGARLKTFDV